MHLTPRVIAIVAISIVVVWASTGAAIIAILPAWDQRGQFGDLFGAVNSLFSGLAFAGVVFALMIQREELQLQRQELRASREEQTRLVNAQQQASDALNRQFTIQTLAAQVSILQTKIQEASSAMQRGTDAVVAALHSGQSGVKSEDFAPGASKRLLDAQIELEVVLELIRHLSKELRKETTT